MGSGSKSTSSSSSKPAGIEFLNPIGAVIANMFGMPVGLSQHGGYRLGADKKNMKRLYEGNQKYFGDFGADGYGEAGSGVDQGEGGYFSDQIFGNGSFESIKDILDVENIFGGDVAGLGEGSAALANNAMGGIEEMLDKLLGLGDRVGEAIDVQPIMDRVTAGLAEQYSSSGMFRSSDTEQSMLRAGGELQVGADTDAIGRYMQATLGAAPLIGSLGAAGSEIGTRTASNLLDLGEQFNMSTATKHGRTKTLLELLAGYMPTGAVPLGNYSKAKSKGTQVAVSGTGGGTTGGDTSSGSAGSAGSSSGAT